MQALKTCYLFKVNKNTKVSSWAALVDNYNRLCGFHIRLVTSSVKARKENFVCTNVHSHMDYEHNTIPHCGNGQYVATASGMLPTLQNQELIVTPHIHKHT